MTKETAWLGAYTELSGITPPKHLKTEEEILEWWRTESGLSGSEPKDEFYRVYESRFEPRNRRNWFSETS